MTPSQQLVPLAPERIAEAYPLVRLVRPELSLDTWRAQAAAALDSAAESAGIMTVQHDKRLILGLFRYSTAWDPAHGPTLRVEDFVAAGPISSLVAARPLAESLDPLARGARCRAIHTVLRPRGGPREAALIALFRDLGYRQRPGLLCKTLGSNRIR